MNENENININEIVKIEKMAVIKQELDVVEKFIDEKTQYIPKVLKDFNKLTDEEKESKKQDIKKYGKYLKNIKDELETKRKAIKSQVLQPYEDFNDYYSNGVLLKLNENIEKISEVVREIEEKQINSKREELQEFVKQHCEDRNIHIDFDSIGLNINLSASMKSLKEQALEFINKVDSDLKLIEMEEYGSEILYEYNKTYNFVEAKTKVLNRHKEINEIEQQQEQKEVIEQEEQKIEEKVEEIIAPKEIINDDEIIKVTFTVKGEKSKIKELKNKIIELELEYE